MVLESGAALPTAPPKLKAVNGNVLACTGAKLGGLTYVLLRKYASQDCTWEEKDKVISTYALSE